MQKPLPSSSLESTTHWWRGAVIYQIYPRSFQDSNEDGIGDLAGITRRLPYLAELGVDAIWLSPFFPSPMKDFGYDVSDYRGVDPIFGSLADFEKLTATAHSLGLKVLIDQVISHTSDLHPWFIESRRDRKNPKADWYVWADAAPDGTAPNNWLSVFGGPAWEWDSRRCQYYMHNFLASQPDLNFHHPEVQDAMLAVLKFWLDLGVDGFRLDTVNYYFHDAALRNNPPQLAPLNSNDAPSVNPYNRQIHLYDKTRPENLAFLERLRALVDRYPGATTIGEVGEGADRSLETMAAYTAGNKRLHMCYTFDLLGPGYGADFLRETFARFAQHGGGWPCWALSNHDVTRHATRYRAHTAHPIQQAALMGAVLLSLRGSVCLYQGEELGLTEAHLAFEDLVDPYGIRFWPEYKGRDGCRTPMVWEEHAPHCGFSGAKPWLPIPFEHRPLAVDQQKDKPDTVLSRYRRFLAFRKQHPALITGAMDFLPASPDILAFLRRSQEETLLCVFNFSQGEVDFTPPLALTVHALEGHGFSGRLKEGKIFLPGEEAFFGQVTQA